MRAKMVSLAVAVESTSSAPLPLIVPAKTGSPTVLSMGRLSPVMGDLVHIARARNDLAIKRDAFSRPNNESCSDGELIGWDRDFGAVGLGEHALPVAASVSSAAMARRALPMLQDSSRLERANRNATVAASSHWPIKIAPLTATTINTFMSRRKCRPEFQAFGKTSHMPAQSPPISRQETLAVSPGSLHPLGSEGRRHTSRHQHVDHKPAAWRPFH